MSQPPPPVPGPAGPGGGGKGRAALIIGLTVAIIAAAVGVAWIVIDPAESTQAAPTQAYGAPVTSADGAGEATGEAQARETAAEASSSAAERTTASPTPTLSAEEQALADLEELRQASLARVVLDGRWVAQVASKSVGITDPLQTAANGTHTFYAVDILAESRAALQTVSNPAQVLLLQSIDFGKRSRANDGQPYWVTLVDAGFSSSDEIEAWCASTYPSMTPEQLANACAARTLTPPHD